MNCSNEARNTEAVEVPPDGYRIKTTPVQGVAGITCFNWGGNEENAKEVWFTGTWDDAEEELPTEDIERLRAFLSKLPKK